LKLNGVLIIVTEILVLVIDVPFVTVTVKLKSPGVEAVALKKKWLIVSLSTKPRELSHTKTVLVLENPWAPESVPFVPVRKAKPESNVTFTCVIFIPAVSVLFIEILYKFITSSFTFPKDVEPSAAFVITCAARTKPKLKTKTKMTIILNTLDRARLYIVPF